MKWLVHGRPTKCGESVEDLAPIICVCTRRPVLKTCMSDSEMNEVKEASDGTRSNTSHHDRL